MLLASLLHIFERVNDQNFSNTKLMLLRFNEKLSFYLFLFRSTGPEHWQDAYSQCSGKHQSPINIDSAHVTRAVLPPLKMEGFFYTEGEVTLVNNGHTGNNFLIFSLHMKASQSPI